MKLLFQLSLQLAVAKAVVTQVKRQNNIEQPSFTFFPFHSFIFARCSTADNDCAAAFYFLLFSFCLFACDFDDDDDGGGGGLQTMQKQQKQ